MGSYKLSFKRSAEKELRRISQPHLSQVLKGIETLMREPRPFGVQMLKGEDRFFRLRVGDYRIIYEVDDAGKAVTIFRIGHRREVYD